MNENAFHSGIDFNEILNKNEVIDLNKVFDLIESKQEQNTKMVEEHVEKARRRRLGLDGNSPKKNIPSS